MTRLLHISSHCLNIKTKNETKNISSLADKINILMNGILVPIKDFSWHATSEVNGHYLLFHKATKNSNLFNQQQIIVLFSQLKSRASSGREGSLAVGVVEIEYQRVGIFQIFTINFVSTPPESAEHWLSAETRDKMISQKLNLIWHIQIHPGASCLQW